jgi:glycosyltransferase involved in cell wall biosynthesis
MVHKTNTPLVSVLMTSYNREKYIAEAIESVLASNYTNFELIIVDDCSNDNTVEIARSYEAKDNRVKVYVNEKNLGDYPNRNKAASYGKGKYLKYLDSDDIIYPYGLQVMVEAMEKYQGAGIGFSFNNYDNSHPLPILFNSEDILSTHFNKKGLINIGPSGCIYKKEVFQNFGGFFDFGVASDFEFHLRVTIYNPAVFLQRDLIWWRVHENQEYRLKEDEYLKQFSRIYKLFFENNDIPLSKLASREIKINIEKNYARKILISFIKFDFKYCLMIFKNIDLTFSSFIYSLIPSKIRKKLILLK